VSWVVWKVRSHLRRRVRMERRVARHRGLSVVHLRSQRQVDAWPGDLEAERRNDGGAPEGPALTACVRAGGQPTRRRRRMPGWMSHTIV
jgi:hypothetical protein